MKEDFIQNIQFDLFSVELVIGETATLLMAENYVTIREVFVDGVKVEPNDEKQIFLPSGGDSLWELSEGDIVIPAENRKYTSKSMQEVDVANGSTDKFFNEQGDFKTPIISHSGVTDKNSETAFQHVDTTTTKETLVEDDKVPIYDSVTGKVVLTNKDNVGGSGERTLTLVTTNNNDFQVDFSGDLHYNTVPAGEINNLGFTCVNCPTTNKEFVYIVTNNRTTLLQTALPAAPIVQGGITYTFKRTTATTTVGISAGASCEFNFLFIKTGDTNFEVRIAVQKSVV